MLLLHDHPHEILFAILSRQTESTTAPVVWDSLQLCLMDLNVVDWTSVTDKSHAQSPTHTWYRYSAVVSSSRGRGTCLHELLHDVLLTHEPAKRQQHFTAASAQVSRQGRKLPQEEPTFLELHLHVHKQLICNRMK